MLGGFQTDSGLESLGTGNSRFGVPFEDQSADGAARPSPRYSTLCGTQRLEHLFAELPECAEYSFLLTVIR